MNEFVIDASAYLFAALNDKDEAAAELRLRIGKARCHAPHHLDAEVGNVLRRLELAGDVSPELATMTLRTLPHLVEQRYPHTGPLANAAWQLRGAVTFYDALYVALAAALNLPLVTSDARLSRAPGLPCHLELFGR
ncbi:type II toxin-antitoxin system VapC family toxin [Streptoalloteichus hindustanus]|uniref:Ribonuclease VapC n=1 Tax=Streptoalloteichus hindustanus TaxID=2017 RepID=A0A1M4XZY1_STRHI|nr:PIN domain-containing protein [Streptoalloteichus hindustanus]SHE99137.1 Predicted nucleic acid-binding protein, contains PIN domain [Streptoalloteichus hindustanus]